MIIHPDGRIEGTPEELANYENKRQRKSVEVKEPSSKSRGLWRPEATQTRSDGFSSVDFLDT